MLWLRLTAFTTSIPHGSKHGYFDRVGKKDNVQVVWSSDHLAVKAGAGPCPGWIMAGPSTRESYSRRRPRVLSRLQMTLHRWPGTVRPPAISFWRRRSVSSGWPLRVGAPVFSSGMVSVERRIHRAGTDGIHAYVVNPRGRQPWTGQDRSTPCLLRVV